MTLLKLYFCLNHWDAINDFLSECLCDSTFREALQQYRGHLSLGIGQLQKKFSERYASTAADLLLSLSECLRNLDGDYLPGYYLPPDQQPSCDIVNNEFQNLCMMGW